MTGRGEDHGGLSRWMCVLIGLLWLAALCAPARALEPEILRSSLQRNPEGLMLSVRLGPVITPSVEAALLKGVPMYFSWQADVYRDRWYWTDKRVSSAVRTLRVAYQPLSRRWRLSWSYGGQIDPEGTGPLYALHQNLDNLADVMAVASRVSNWEIAEASHLESDAHHRVEWRFQLDLSLLPRPFQLGMVNQPDWDIDVRGEMDVPEQVHADPMPEPSHAAPGEPPR